MLKEFLNRFFRGDKIIWFVLFSLLLVSTLVVYTATSQLAFNSIGKGDYNKPILSHVGMALAGITAAFLIHLFDIRKAYKVIPVATILGGIAQLVTFFVGRSTNSAQRWLEYGGISFQPSEISKIVFVLFMGYCMHMISIADKEDKTESIKKYNRLICGASMFFILVIFMSNVSTALLMSITGLVTLWVTGFSRKILKMALFGSVGLLLSGFLMAHFIPQTRNIGRIGTEYGRITRFFDNKKDDDGKKFKLTKEEFQPTHAKIAIANSKLIGLGPGGSKERSVLPQAYSDFIFAIIIEEYGLLGALFVLMLYAVLMYRIGSAVAKSTTMFSAVVLIGFGVSICTQATMNMMVAVGIMPVTGQPLPLVSRGGTSEILTCVVFGIILSLTNFELKDSKKMQEEAKTAETESN